MACKSMPHEASATIQVDPDESHVIVVDLFKLYTYALSLVLFHEQVTASASRVRHGPEAAIIISIWSRCDTPSRPLVSLSP